MKKIYSNFSVIGLVAAARVSANIIPNCYLINSSLVVLNIGNCADLKVPNIRYVVIEVGYDL